MILGCRNQTVTILKFPRSFIENYIERMNTSVDDEGKVKHYHIVLFKNPDGKITMLLSKPIWLRLIFQIMWLLRSKDIVRYRR